MSKLKNLFPSILFIIVVVVAQFAYPTMAQAAGTVGTGTPASCTEAALNTALSGGGAVNFNCGAAPVTIAITSTKTISSNTQMDGGGLITISGGNSWQMFVVQSAATLSLNTITLANGNAGSAQGGAIAVNSGATATISDSTFLNNTSAFDSAAVGVAGGAGAIYNAGTLTVTGSTFSGNSATGPGGDGGAIMSNGAVTITNSTFVGNGAVTDGTGGTGGAMRLDGGAGPNTITHVTLSNNFNDAAFGTLDINNTSATLSLSILGNSTTGLDCTKRNGGTLTSTNNLIEDGATCTPASTLDPGLGALQNNGGPTQTMSITTASPAYNFTASCPLATDQRGVARPQPSAGNCDLGAYELDNTVPTVTMSSAAPDPTNTSPIPVTVQFSEGVTGFTAGDITPGNGIVGNFVAVDADTYTFDLTPSGQGLVTANIAASVAFDIAGNGNTAATQFSRTFDSIAPTVTIGSPSPTTTNIGPVDFSITITGASTINLTAGDISLNTTGTATGTVSITNGTTATPTVTISGITGSGTIGISIAAGIASDAAGNTSAAAGPSATFTVDNDGPTVTINQAASQADPTGTSPINFTVVFSEAVTGFDGTDVNLSGTAGATTALVTGGSTTYNVAVSGMSGDGTVIASVATGAVTDSLGNSSAASTSTDNSVTYDTMGPSVTINQAAGQADPTGSSPIDFTVVFSEAVSGFTGSDVNFSGSTAGGTLTASVSGGPATYTVSVTGMASSGTVVASIPAGSATDSTSNGNTASSSTDNTVTFDTSAPTVTINQATGQADPTNTSPINFTAVFSEPVTGFTSPDVSLSGSAGATTAVVSEIAPNDGTTYNVAVSGMVTAGTVTASIPAGIAQDTLGNQNLASSSTDNTVVYDLGFPIVTSSTPPDGGTITTNTSQLRVSYNENVRSGGALVVGAADNIANYLLIGPGANTTFDSVSCLAGVGGDDTLITINSASYSNNGGSGPFVARLNITPLAVGTYRLHVCGTTSIQDLAGNELNDGLADTIIDFTVVQGSSQPGGGGAGAQLPETGFPQGQVTSLSPQPAEKAYTATDLWIELPKLGVKMSIVGVPLTDENWDVTWLGKDAGWLNGSAFPTWNGNSVLTGHVWDAFNGPGPFARLKELKYGDQIRIHAYGQVYVYEVRQSLTVSPTQVASVFKHEEKSWLTLITCEEYKELAQTYTYRRMIKAVLVTIATAD